MLVPIRKEMPWPQAALMGCCVPTGVGAVTRCAEVEAGASVVVIGCGGVGLNVVQGARLAGARMIVACDLLDNKLEYAREFGATHTINAGRQSVGRHGSRPDGRPRRRLRLRRDRRRGDDLADPRRRSAPAARRSSWAWPP
jgi:Zn-dependent alcohol dehydrogenase